MQVVDFEMKYQPGKDEADALDFLSRHPLPDTEEDGTEYAVIAIIKEPAVIINTIREETSKDDILMKLKEVIQKGDWEMKKRDTDIAPFYPVKDELFIADDLIFRFERIVLPEKQSVLHHVSPLEINLGRYIFGHHGTPGKLESDNGLSFNSKECRIRRKRRV